jgi:hypothetical protein
MLQQYMRSLNNIEEIEMHFTAVKKNGTEKKMDVMFIRWPE